MRKGGLWIFCMILLSSFAAADYINLGNQSGDYTADQGAWSSVSSADSTPTVAGDFEFVPLAADLDNDSVVEIVALTETTVNIYTYSLGALSLEDSYTLAHANTDGRKTMGLYDLDDDDFLEIVVVDDSYGIEITEYNGTVFTHEVNYSSSDMGDYSAGESMFGCDESSNQCVIAYTKDDNIAISDGTYDYIYSYRFNISDIDANRLQVASASHGSFQYAGLICMPNMRDIAVADYDQDNDIEFIFTSMVIQNNAGANEEGLWIFYLGINASGSVTEEQEIRNTDAYIQSGMGSGSYCNDCAARTGNCDPDANGGFGGRFSSPIVFNFDGAIGNKHETVLATQTSDNDFRIYAYYAGGAELSSYPEATEGDGELVSNVARIHVKTDTGGAQDTDRYDVCAMGFDDVGEVMEILCGSAVTNDLIPTEEFYYNATYFGFGSDVFPWNISEGYHQYENLIHATEQYSTQEQGANLDEISLSFGLFDFDYSGLNHINELFLHSVENAVVVPADVEQNSRADLLMLTSTNLWYYDDGWTNEPPSFTTWDMDPCYQYTWQNGTEVTLQLTATDPEADTIRYKAILYNGESFAQDSGWSTYIASGTTHTITLNANTSTSSSQLHAVVQDSGSGVNDTLTWNIAVASDGIVKGDIDCQSTVEETEDEATNLTTDVTDNGINSLAEVVVEYTGLGKTLAWLLFMIAIAGLTFIEGSRGNFDHGHTLGFIAFEQGLLILVGVFLGFIAVSVLITIMILAIAVIGIMFYRGMSSGG